MIFEWLFSAFIGILKTIFSLLPNLPDLPVFIDNSLDYLINLIFDNVQLLGFFIRISTIKILVPLILIVINFDRIYRLCVWIIHKLPISID